MNFARTTSGVYFCENIDPIYQSSYILTKDEQMKRLGMVKKDKFDDKFQVIKSDGTIYRNTRGRSTFSFDTAESIVEKLAEEGIIAESVKII